MWCTTWKTSDQPLAQLSDTHAYTMTGVNFPNVNVLLKVLITIPVTSASTERANSALKYIKTDLRSTMGQAMLNTFVLGYKHKGLLRSIPTKVFVDKFVNLKKRRLYLNDPLSE